MMLMKEENWDTLYEVTKSYLEQTRGKSFAGYFYMGISFYKEEDYENAIKAFEKAEGINSEDA